MLELNGIQQCYGSSHILRGVDLSLPDGALTVLLGRNGVGKTTLLKCLMGVLPVRAGSIHLDGRDITRLPPHERVRAGLAYVPQGREIFPRLSVTDNLRMGAASRPARNGIPEHIYTLFPVLKEMGARMGGDLSGGQQQQLAIARAIMSEPRWIILDEPTEGIQPNIITQIGQTLRHLVERLGISVLLVEQYLEFVKPLADRYAVMSRGQVVATGEGQRIEADGVEEWVRV